MSETKTLDKLYLEYSNITSAKTAKEVRLEHKIKDQSRIIDEQSDTILRLRATIKHSGLKAPIEREAQGERAGGSNPTQRNAELG